MAHFSDNMSSIELSAYLYEQRGYYVSPSVLRERRRNRKRGELLCAPSRQGGRKRGPYVGRLNWPRPEGIDELLEELREAV